MKKNILFTFIALFTLVGLSAQEIQYGVSVDDGNGRVTFSATPNFSESTAQLTSALFTFTMPKGTAFVPGGTVNSKNGTNWQLQRLTQADLPNPVSTVLDSTDVYVVSFTGPIGLTPNLVDGQPLDLFCFVIVNGCNGGGVINILDDEEADALGTAFDDNYTFRQQFSLLLPNGDPKCTCDVYVGNDADMPECPPVLVPTMGQWALFLFGLFVFTLGIVVVYNISRAKQMA